MEKRIAVLSGDGIGPEVMTQAVEVLRVVGEKFGHTLTFADALIGGAAYDVYRDHCPGETLEICRSADAILFGSVGGPVNQAHVDKWNRCEANSILTLRKAFRFNANFRPVKIFPELLDASPLKKEVVEKGVDFIIVRELLGDLYFGEKKRFERMGRRIATDLCEYSEDQIASIARIAFQAAGKRRKKVTSVDKANVLETSKLWRAVVHEVAQEYPDVSMEDMLVDNCAMQIVSKPYAFDVIVTSNMFGDILSDEGAVVAGSLGVLSSASMNNEGFGLYEPPGGSAPDLAGKGIANPIGQILSAAMMLRFSFSLAEEADAIESAVSQTLRSGIKTPDIAIPGEIPVTTQRIGEEIRSRILKWRRSTQRN